MKRFILKIVKCGTPIFLFLCLYVALDPCAVIWNFGQYPDYKANNSAFNSYLLLTAKEPIPYNSFIVGSSRSWNWPWEEWEKRLDSTALAFHLDQSGDGCPGALERLRFVYAHVPEVKNVLLVVDAIFLEQTHEDGGIQYRTPWQMKQKKDYFAFQIAALRFFLSWNGIKSYWQIGEDYKHILPYYYDERHEPHFIGKEQALAQDPENYYAHYAMQHSPIYRFPQRDTIEQVGAPVLRKENIRMLSEIHDLFVQGGTNYKVVVSPVYDQVKLNPRDKAVLDSLFGEKNVYDFSGINEFTQDSLNYYEASHYRPCVSKQLLKIMYGF